MACMVISLKFNVFELQVMVLPVCSEYKLDLELLLLSIYCTLIIYQYLCSSNLLAEGEDFTINPIDFSDIRGFEGISSNTFLLILDDSFVEELETVVLQPFSDPIGRLAFSVDDVIQITIVDNDGKHTCEAESHALTPSHLTPSHLTPSHPHALTVPVFNVTPGETAVIESDLSVVNTIELVQGILTVPIFFTVNTQTSPVVNPPPGRPHPHYKMYREQDTLGSRFKFFIL